MSIDVYFEAGMKFNWTKPEDGHAIFPGAVFPDRGGIENGPADGLVVASEKPATVMNYMGIHPAATGSRRLPRVINGIRQIEYRWCDYTPGRTTTIALNHAGKSYDIITGPMSGCLVTTWRNGQNIYASHSGTSDKKSDNTTLKREFNRYIRRHQSGVPRSIKGFLPDRLWTAAEMAELMARFGIQRVPDIFAIVTATGRMCSVLMGKVPDNRSSTGQWVSLGVKQCTNIMNYNDITAFCAVAPSRAPVRAAPPPRVPVRV